MDGNEGAMAAATALETPAAAETAAAASRDERFAALVASHRERARRLAWRLVGGDESAAEDVVQDAFVRAYRALDRFRGDSSLETWFYRILVRQAHHHRRWRALRDRWNDVLEGEPADPSPRGPGDPGLRQRIGAALSKLSRRQREAFVLVHVEGFTVRECAAVLGKPTGTVKSHLHRALRSLRSELADLHRSDEGERAEGRSPS
ncbi:MAG: RNA polymerase sigma factor [Myxococcales bacterium]|nr:RNA polymerase sigma factor [Myxococcales bacterium]